MLERARLIGTTRSGSAWISPSASAATCAASDAIGAVERGC
jgi:hypothetical protein